MVNNQENINAITKENRTKEQREKHKTNKNHPPQKNIISNSQKQTENNIWENRICKTRKPEMEMYDK